MTSSLSSLPSGRFRPPMIPCLSILSFFKFCCIPRPSSSPVIFALVFPFLFYPPFFLLLILFEVSPFSLYIASSSVVLFLLSLTGIFLLLPVLTPHLIWHCALSNWSSPSYGKLGSQREPASVQSAPSSVFPKYRCLPSTWLSYCFFGLLVYIKWVRSITVKYTF